MAEGAYTVEAALALANSHGVEMPIAQEVYNALYRARASSVPDRLLSREQKDELADYDLWVARQAADGEV